MLTNSSITLIKFNVKNILDVKLANGETSINCQKTKLGLRNLVSTVMKDYWNIFNYLLTLNSTISKIKNKQQFIKLTSVV